MHVLAALRVRALAPVVFASLCAMAADERLTVDICAEAFGGKTLGRPGGVVVAVVGGGLQGGRGDTRLLIIP